MKLAINSWPMGPPGSSAVAQTEIVTFPQNWGHKLGKFNYENRAYLTYNWYVFRAEAAQALLTISDWQTDNEPGGPVGQEVMVNFIEVQPYFEGPPTR